MKLSGSSIQSHLFPEQLQSQREPIVSFMDNVRGIPYQFAVAFATADQAFSAEAAILIGSEFGRINKQRCYWLYPVILFDFPRLLDGAKILTITIIIETADSECHSILHNGTSGVGLHHRSVLTTHERGPPSTDIQDAIDLEIDLVRTDVVPVPEQVP